MKTVSRYFIVFGLSFGFILLGVRIFLEVDLKDFYVLMRAPTKENMRPAGDIHKGVKLSQEINTSLLLYDKEQASKDLCVETLLATHGDRHNEGSFFVGLSLDDKDYTKTVDVNEVLNNSYHRVCFESIKVGDLSKASNATLFLEGIDSPRGESITAWTTASNALGKLSVENGPLADRSLLYRIGYTSHPSGKRFLDSVILLLIFCILILLLAYPAFRKNGK